MAKQYDILFRLLLIGDSGVGKTCMICRFAEDEFNDSHMSTIGIDFKMKTLTIKDKKVRIQIWDTAGQERYDTITKQYYRRAQGIILVYDITNESSFENIYKWHGFAKSHGNDDVDMVLVANKQDMGRFRRISSEQGQRLAKELQVPFFETSAKNDDNITQVFMQLSDLILSKNKKSIEAITLYSREDSESEFESELLKGRKDSQCC